MPKIEKKTKNKTKQKRNKKEKTQKYDHTGSFPLFMLGQYWRAQEIDNSHDI